MNNSQNKSRKPVQTKIRQVSTTLSKKEQYEEGMVYLEKVKALQAGLDEYNKNLVNIDPRFNDLILNGRTLIVRFKHEDFIKYWTKELKYVDEDVQQEIEIPIIGYSKIDGRRSTSDKETYVDNPLPYLFEGVVCAFSKEAADMIEKSSGHRLQVGDRVNMCEFTLKDRRFYLDKAKAQQDHIATQTETRLSNFEGYFKVDAWDIESIVKPQA